VAGDDARCRYLIQQRRALWLAARPLQPQDRQGFLDAVASELGGRVEVGDGELHRLVRKLQWKFLTPPAPPSAPGALLRP
jgi:hypothetical protein